jgi:lysophospholipase L1-like esterase
MAHNTLVKNALVQAGVGAAAAEAIAGGFASSDVVSGSGYGPVVVMDGDSRTANGVDAVLGYTAYGYGSWVRALAQCRPVTANFAVSGNTASDVRARTARVAALRPFAVVRWVGVNGIASGRSGASEAALTIASAQEDLAHGAQYVILLLETGFVGWGAGPVAEMLALNRALIAFAATNRNIRIVNTLDLVVDYTAAAQVPITYRSGVFADTVHPSVNLSYQIGARVAAVIDSLWKGIDTAPMLMPGDTSNLLSNPHFGTTAAISGWPGWTGTFPTGWFGFQSGTVSITSAVQANASAGGVREVQLTLTASAAGNAQLWQDPVAGIVAGDSIVGAAEIEVVGTPSGLQQVHSQIYTLVGGVTKQGMTLFYTGGYDPLPPASSWPQVAMTQRSPETSVVTVGAGTQTAMRFGLSVDFRTAGSAVVRFRKPYVKKVPSGYYS